MTTLCYCRRRPMNHPIFPLTFRAMKYCKFLRIGGCEYLETVRSEPRLTCHFCISVTTAADPSYAGQCLDWYFSQPLRTGDFNERLVLAAQAAIHSHQHQESKR